MGSGTQPGKELFRVCESIGRETDRQFSTERGRFPATEPKIPLTKI